MGGKTKRSDNEEDQTSCSYSPDFSCHSGRMHSGHARGPHEPMVDTKKPVSLKSTEVCNGTFAVDTTTASGNTIRDAASKAGIKKIFSIQYETKNYVFFTRFCAVVKGM